MIKRIYHQQISCVQVFKHASNRYLDIEERETWNALQKPAAKQSHAREYGTGVQSTLFVFPSAKWVQHKLPVQLHITHNGLNQEEVTA